MLCGTCIFKMSSVNANIAPGASDHSYLGEFSSSRLYDRSFLDEEEVVEIPLLLFNKLVLFPGETLPLRIQRHLNEGLFTLLKSYVASQSLSIIGIVNKLSPNVSLGDHDIDYLNYSSMRTEDVLAKHGIPPVGVTLEISSYQMENEDELILVGKCRERFDVIDLVSKDRVSYGKVKLLSDNQPVYPPYLENHALLGNCYGRNSTDICNAAVNPFPQWV